jgi:hypothetical protein
MYRVESKDAHGAWQVDRVVVTLSAAIILASSFYDWFATTHYSKLRDDETRIICPDGSVL